MIAPKQNLNTDTGFGQQLTEWLAARSIVRFCFLVAGTAFAQAMLSGPQVMAQPIFRTPQLATPVKQSLQLTGPGESKMAPIRNVGLGEGSASPFQLPQTGQPRGFLPTPSAAPQTESLRGQELREVGVDGSFLPTDPVSDFEPNQVDSMIDLPGLDLSAMGFDVQDQSDDESQVLDADDRELEQLPLSLGQTDVPQPQPDRVRRERVVENYPDGQPRLLRTVALDREGNYYNDGPWVVKDREGRVVAAGTYRKGVMQGQWARRHTSAEGGIFTEKPFTQFQGPYDSIANFKAGKLDGQWIVYDRAKRSIFEIGYKDGVRDGLATWFYPDTTKMRQATFKEGILDGEVTEWTEDGKLVSKEYYRDGRKLIRNTSFYRPKVPKEESYYLDVKLRQNGLDNWWDAKPAPYLASGERVQNGQARGWYSNRQLQYQGQFRNDEPVGRFFWWHENGNRSTVGQFNRDGDRDGRWIWWHENGMKKIEGSYQDDQPSGVWRSWDNTGKLIKNKDYDNLPETPDDQTNPLNGFSALDVNSEQGLIEGLLESEAGEQDLEGDGKNGENSGPVIGSGVSEQDGLLPLPEDDYEAVEPERRGEGTRQLLDEQEFESLPPALGAEGVEEAAPEIKYADEAAIIRNVGVTRERVQVDQDAWGHQVFPNGEAVVEPEINIEPETNVIENGVIDDAAEAFDLGELFE